jgi:anti-sigma factor ChrR (cupin superfamily)
MGCGWSREIDLAAALRERDAALWRAFHAHHPMCPDCRRALAPWLRLDALVREATAPAAWHPSDESLLALLEGSRNLDPAERQEVVAHLDACAPCRDAVLAVAALERP